MVTKPRIIDALRSDLPPVRAPLNRSGEPPCRLTFQFASSQLPESSDVCTDWTGFGPADRDASRAAIIHDFVLV